MQAPCEYCESVSYVESMGYMVCTKCGYVGMAMMSDYNGYNDRKYMRKICRHNRVKWFRNIARDHIHHSKVREITGDFQDVVRCIERFDLIKGRNVVKYSFYLLRLCARKGIEVSDEVRDFKTSCIMRKYEDILFGEVYPRLSWGDASDYYKDWFSYKDKCNGGNTETTEEDRSHLQKD